MGLLTALLPLCTNTNLLDVCSEQKWGPKLFSAGSFATFLKNMKFNANKALFRAKNKNKLLNQVRDAEKVLIYKPMGFERRQSEPRMSDKRVSSGRKWSGAVGCREKWSKVQHLHIHCNEARLVEIQESFPFNDMIIFLAAAYYLGWNWADSVGIV